MAVLLLQVFPVFIGIAVTLLVAVTFLNARKKVQASEESNPRCSNLLTMPRLLIAETDCS